MVASLNANENNQCQCNLPMIAEAEDCGVGLDLFPMQRERNDAFYRVLSRLWDSAMYVVRRSQVNKIAGRIQTLHGQDDEPTVLPQTEQRHQYFIKFFSMLSVIFWGELANLLLGGSVSIWEYCQWVYHVCGIRSLAIDYCYYIGDAVSVSGCGNVESFALSNRQIIAVNQAGGSLGVIYRRIGSVLTRLLDTPGIRFFIMLSLAPYAHAFPTQRSEFANGSIMSLWSLALTVTLAWTLGHVGKRMGRQSLSRKVGMSLFILLLGTIALSAVGDANGGGAEVTIAALILMLLGVVWPHTRATTSEPLEDSCPNTNCPNPENCDGSCSGAGPAPGGG
ncbi:hypothetical protein BKA65DRAFT_508213, partial [Rhexocercosporidium sp. MPI-PUGE-AT-0058]